MAPYKPQKLVKEIVGIKDKKESFLFLILEKVTLNSWFVVL